jgi:hypothetical protein
MRLSKYNPSARKGFNLSINGTAPGYNSTGNHKHVYFGVDNGKVSEWKDCGRPSENSHTSDSLTVFEGSMFAGISDAKREEDWAHVFQYKGGQAWEDCGRLGKGRTIGVYPMVVHNGALYAATTSSHGRVPPGMDYGHVYRYQGGKEWEDCGQPQKTLRLNAMASYRGRLYICGYEVGAPPPLYCSVYEGGTKWRPVKAFERAGTLPHTMGVHDGKLYVAVSPAEVYSYDGDTWESLGNPYGSLEISNQVHCIQVYRGELHVGTWPQGRVAVRRKGKWEDCGRLGDATEVVSLLVYNGKLYAGTIPRAEVFRYEGGRRWTSMRRLFAPEGWESAPRGGPGNSADWTDWTRAGGLTIYGGKLFASTATCTRNLIKPMPNETRGRVYSMEAGKNISYDHDLGSGWKHLVAVRDHENLRLYVDGELKASERFNSGDYDISNREPLRIGFGEIDYFSGKIREVRVYNRALTDREIPRLHAEGRSWTD